MTHDNLDPKLTELFQSYRQACPEVDGGANFMPALWQKIEARQTIPFAMRRLTRLFVSAAVALCLVMTLLSMMPKSPLPVTLFSYVEALDRDHPQELMAYADIDLDGTGDSLWD